MPKTSTVTKDMIIDASFEIVRKEGFSALSARNVAKKMNCSTQPIYWIYENMEILKQDVISKMTTFLSTQISSYKKTGKPFLDIGLGYVHIAFSEPVLFKSVYVDNIKGVKLTDIVPNEMITEKINVETNASGIPNNRLKDIAVKSWIFAHGLASLVATGMIEYDEEKIEQLLCSFFEEISKYK